jgi:hypothetical protein
VLTAKEKTIHTQGLVGVLKALHDELDAAVLQAYGWDDLANTFRQAQESPSIRFADPVLSLSKGQGERSRAQGKRSGTAGERNSDDLLTRLVALNAQRAAEEKTGHIRWLRPAFQNPQAPAPSQALSNKELPAQVLPGLQADLALNVPLPASKNASNLPAWPATLPEQVRAVAQVLSTATAALPLSVLEASFKGKGPWKKGLPRILETLEALGRARRVEAAAGVLWQA